MENYALVQKFVEDIAVLACADFEGNQPTRTGSEIAVAVSLPEPAQTQNFLTVGKTVYRHARSARYYQESSTVVDVMKEIVGLVPRDLPDNMIYQNAPLLSAIAYSTQRWYIHLYNRLRELVGLSVVELPQESRRIAAMEKLQAELDAQRILHPDVVGVSVAHDSQWVSQTEEIMMICDNGHSVFLSPQYAHECLDKRGERSLCRQCRKPYTAKVFQGRANGYRFKKAHMYECETCGTETQRAQVSLRDFAACKGCEEDGMENETVWVALDKDPFIHAFVWVGRMPNWIYDIQDQVDIEPVWAEVKTMQPPSFFRSQETRRGRTHFQGQFDPIGRLDVSGIDWIDMGVSDVMARALTVNSRLVRGQWVLSRAIDYIAGRDPKSRYAGDDGFLPLNFYHNPELEGWEKGKPKYAFDIEPSPLAKSLGIA